MQHACKPRHEYKKKVFEILGSGRLGADVRIKLTLIGKNVVWKFTSPKVGYAERGNELFLLPSEVGLFHKYLLYFSTKLLQLCKKCFHRKEH